jgi:hypothetical protein
MAPELLVRVVAGMPHFEIQGDDENGITVRINGQWRKWEVPYWEWFRDAA